MFTSLHSRSVRRPGLLAVLAARRRTLRPWQVAAVALAIATIAFATWTLSARADVSAVSFIALDDVAGEANADYAISFASSNTAVTDIEVTFPDGYQVANPTNLGVHAGENGLCNLDVGEICFNDGETTAAIASTSVDGQVIRITLNSPQNFGGLTASFVITAGITNPTLSGVKPMIRFTVGTLGVDGEAAVASGVDVTIVPSADLSGSITYAPSGATVGTTIPPSTTITTFFADTALVAGDKIVMAFPAGTSLIESNIVVGDFLIVQGPAGTSVTGAATAPAAAIVNAAERTLTLTITTASLSTVGDSAGKGTVTVTTSTSAAFKIAHPTTVTTTGIFRVDTTDSAGTVKDFGSISDVTFVAGLYDASASTVATSATQVVYGSTITTSLTARDAYSNPILDLVVGDVSFALGGGGTSAGSFAVATNGGSGVYNATFTPTAAGTASTLTARYAGDPNAAGPQRSRSRRRR